MVKLKYIFISALLFIGGVSIKIYADTLTIEQQRQFLYYYYEAERLIQTSQTEQARPLVEFCYLLNPNDATINNLMGHYAQQDQNPLQMLAYYHKAFELAPNDYWYNYNVLLLQTEMDELELKAIKNLEQVATDNPRNEDVHHVLQKAYVACKMYEEALRLQNRIDSINGYNEQSAMQRYQLNIALKNYSQAIHEIERYLAIDPDNYQFQVFRLQLYEQTEQPYEKLIEAYEAVLRFDSRNTGWLNNLAWALCITGGDLERAESLSLTTIMAEPTNPVYLDTYAWIQYHLGNCEEAYFFILKAMDNMTKETSKEISSHYKEIKRKCKK